MRRAVLIALGAIVLCGVTFANPLEGNVLGFCPVSEGPKAVAVDGVVALLDAASIWLLYLGLRA